MMSRLAENTPVGKVIGRLMSACINADKSKYAKKDQHVLAFACSVFIIKHAQMNGENTKSILNTMEEFRDFKDVKKEMLEG